jgi:hypothetical protein
MARDDIFSETTDTDLDAFGDGITDESGLETELDIEGTGDETDYQFGDAATAANEDVKNGTGAAAPAKAEAEDTSEHEASVQAFITAADTAAEASDTSTGTVPEADLDNLSNLYRDITGGVKFKNQARTHLSDKMVEALEDEAGYHLARAYNNIQQEILTAAKKKAPSAPRATVTAEQVFADRVAVIQIGLDALIDSAPDTLGDWQSLLPDVGDLSEQVTTWLEWNALPEAEQGDEPELGAIAKAAAKVALGKAPTKVRTASSGSASSGPTYEGPRRNVAAHILNAFADKASGTFLSVAEIRATKSEEYGDDAPSAGAISARLFPKSGKVSVEGIIPGENEKGVNGATKA